MWGRFQGWKQIGVNVAFTFTFKRERRLTAVSIKSINENLTQLASALTETCEAADRCLKLGNATVSVRRSFRWWEVEVWVTRWDFLPLTLPFLPRSVFPQKTPTDVARKQDLGNWVYFCNERNLRLQFCFEKETVIIMNLLNIVQFGHSNTLFHICSYKHKLLHTRFK